MDAAKTPDPKDIGRLRQLAAEIPNTLEYFGSGPLTRLTLIQKTSHGSSQALLLAEVDKLKEDLGYAAAPPLERLLVDHLLTVRVQLIHAERVYTSKVTGKSLSLQEAAYWESFLTTSHNRFLRAVEALARVRRLSRNTPALQINIAQEGGKQVNVQGEVAGARPTASPTYAL